VRPSEVSKFDNPENPMSLDNLIKSTGADCLPFHAENKMLRRESSHEQAGLCIPPHEEVIR